MKYELMEMCSQNAVIKVIGVGGGGGNAVNHMSSSGIEGVEFICTNTDAQALDKLDVDKKVQLGMETTKGLGAGTDPGVGEKAAMEDKDRIREIMEGADMLFLTAGMGGGTGTGAIPVFAELAREMGILTVAIVTKPFEFEGPKKLQEAKKGIGELEKHVDSLITIPNQKLLSILGDSLSLVTAFNAANNVLLEAVQGITELITNPGLINVDFADVKTVMADMGVAIMGTGSASGENRAREAAEKAIACPLLEDINLQGAQGILVNISASDVSISEFNEVGSIVHEFASEDAVYKIGTAIDPSLGDEIKVTVVATGMGGASSVIGVKSVIPIKTSGEVDYKQLDRPTIIRSGGAGNRETRFGAQPKNETDLDFLDIPAFLRRQAD